MLDSQPIKRTADLGEPLLVDRLARRRREEVKK